MVVIEREGRRTDTDPIGAYTTMELRGEDVAFLAFLAFISVRIVKWMGTGAGSDARLRHTAICLRIVSGVLLATEAHSHCGIVMLALLASYAFHCGEIQLSVLRTPDTFLLFF